MANFLWWSSTSSSSSRLFGGRGTDDSSWIGLKCGARGVGDVGCCDGRDLNTGLIFDGDGARPDVDGVGAETGFGVGAGGLIRIGAHLNTGLILDGARPGVDGAGVTVGGGAVRAAPLSRLHAL
jgi:hypothetical protein